jgi:hypothetical protein
LMERTIYYKDLYFSLKRLCTLRVQRVAAVCLNWGLETKQSIFW